MQNQNPPIELSEKRLPLTVLRLAWPIVLQEAAWTILAMIIMFFIGHLGAEAITAVGLSESIVSLPQVAFTGIGVGATAVVARHVGAREPELAEAFGMKFEIHLGTNPMALAASLHLACSIKNSDCFEWAVPERPAYDVKWDIKPDGEGYVHVPQGPGLGLEVDHEYISGHTVVTL